MAAVYAAEATLQGVQLPAVLTYYADGRAADATSAADSMQALVEAYERIDAEEGSLWSAFVLAVAQADAALSNGYTAALHAYESSVDATEATWYATVTAADATYDLTMSQSQQTFNGAAYGALATNLATGADLDLDLATGGNSLGVTLDSTLTSNAVTWFDTVIGAGESATSGSIGNGVTASMAQSGAIRSLQGTLVSNAIAAHSTTVAAGTPLTQSLLGAMTDIVDEYTSGENATTATEAVTEEADTGSTSTPTSEPNEGDNSADADEAIRIIGLAGAVAKAIAGVSIDGGVDAPTPELTVVMPTLLDYLTGKVVLSWFSGKWNSDRWGLWNERRPVGTVTASCREGFSLWC